MTILALIGSQYIMWRSWEESRARKHVRVPGGRLPSPVPALPKWLGFIGGHTLLVKPTGVRLFEELGACCFCVLLAGVYLNNCFFGRLAALRVRPMFLNAENSVLTRARSRRSTSTYSSRLERQKSKLALYCCAHRIMRSLLGRPPVGVDIVELFSCACADERRTCEKMKSEQRSVCVLVFISFFLFLRLTGFLDRVGQ